MAGVQRADQVDAVVETEADVDQRDLRAPPVCCRQRFVEPVGGLDLVALEAEQSGQAVGKVAVVVDQEDRGRGLAPAGAIEAARLPSRGLAAALGPLGPTVAQDPAPPW